MTDQANAAAQGGRQGGAQAIASAARRRKLHVGHFAFMRALVQGMPAAMAWERYLRTEGSSGDKRLVRSTTAWIREEFASAARRYDRFGTARLVRMDASRIRGAADRMPSLEEFAQEHGLEHESEAHQVAAYRSHHGSRTHRLDRRAQLVERQLAALRWLQDLIAQPPNANDAVVAWLDPVLASLMEAAGIFTISQLIDRINGLGMKWHSGIRSVGQRKADRIVAWCKEHQDSLNKPLGAHVASPRTTLWSHELAAVVASSSTEVRPLEKFVVPAELDGSRGSFRRPPAQCRLKVSSDRDAILAWLKSKKSLTPSQKAVMQSRRRHRPIGVHQESDWLQTLSNTQRAYRKEAERFVLWAILKRGKPLSSMTADDCLAYCQFLGDPQPQGQWCGTRSRERWSPLWRPFEGPLSNAARRQSITILKNLYGFLVDQNYLMGNPWSEVMDPRGDQPRNRPARSLSIEQWDFVKGQLDELPDSSANRRLAFGLHLLYATGLGLAEAVSATVNDLQWVHYPSDDEDAQPLQGWMLDVAGRRGRQVPVPTELVSELSSYLDHRALSPDPLDPGNRGAHLLGQATDMDERAPALLGAGRGSKRTSFDPRQGIAPGTFHDQIKRFFATCSNALRARHDAAGADTFARASTHWLRHTHAAHAIAGGMPVEIAQQNLGHASLATTSAYVTPESKRQLRAAQAFWRQS